MEGIDRNATTESASMGGDCIVPARESTREDEQACEAGAISKRRREHFAPDVIEDTISDDGKRVRSSDNGGASGAIFPCDREETRSFLFSSRPRAAASGNVLDPSGSGETVQQLRSFEIDPTKHKIFLSHSGAQKNFVEQLCVDLEARGYSFPFFDQRHHSLPKGKDFAPLIKQAAKQCHVPVIVLSEEFICSKWPMIELAEFHAAKQSANHRMSMLPLFYKLKVGDLDDESIEGRWMPVWKKLASRDQRIDVSRWAAAIRALRGVNGLPFGKNTDSEVAYRREIVGSIWKMSPGDLLYDSAQEMVGYDRICEIVSREFVNCNMVGASVLGLYGTSGAGKTTVAKALCDYFAGEFVGKVCLVELGAMTRTKRQKLMLKTLCGIEEDVLKRLLDDRKGLKLMREMMKREPVLLVIDNLTNDYNSRREAHEYLTLGFHPKSRVMITAMSKELLEDLVPGVEFCMSIPELNEDEAGMIFLRSAAPMKCFSLVTDEERRVLRLCVEKCLLDSSNTGYSVRDENSNKSLFIKFRYGAYHPLALKALGDYFYRLGANSEVLQWKDSLERDHELMKDVLQSPSITSIIRLQFSTFSWSEQLLFLDIAFYMDRNPNIDRKRFGLWKTLGQWTYKFWVDRLAILHGETASAVESRLRDLKRSGMINWKNEDLSSKWPLEFEVHSLYREFAKWYMTEHGVSGLKNVWGVFQPCHTSLRSNHQGSKCISDLVGLRVFEPPRASLRIIKRMRELQNLVVLQLYDCTNLRVLSLVGLDSLLHLELVELPQLVTVMLVESSSTQEDGGIFESLVYARLSGLDSLTHLPDLRSCTSLLTLEFFNCKKVTNFGVVECPHMKKMMLQSLAHHQLGSLPNFRSLPCLTELHVSLDGSVDLQRVMDIACPYKWKNYQSVALLVREDYDESDDDYDGYIYDFIEHREDCGSNDSESDSDDENINGMNLHFMTWFRQRRTMYMRRENRFVKEGLRIVQNVLSYLYNVEIDGLPIFWWELGFNETSDDYEATEDDEDESRDGSRKYSKRRLSYLTWRFGEGDIEKLIVAPTPQMCNSMLSTLSIRFIVAIE